MKEEDFKQIESYLSEQSGLVYNASQALDSRDYTVAEYYLKKAAEGGSASPARTLALIYLKRGLFTDAAHILIRYMELCRYDGRRSPFGTREYSCTDNIRHGSVSEFFKNETRTRFSPAAGFLKEKAVKGETEACFLYGAMLHYGLVNGAVPGEALLYLRRAADMQYAPAYLYTGLEYMAHLHDTAGIFSVSDALPWIALACADAQNRQGSENTSFPTGLNTDRNYADALCSLAMAYAAGCGNSNPFNTECLKTGTALLEEAAAKGSAEALYLLAETHLTQTDGKTQKYSPEKAFVYFLLSAKKGFRPAVTAIAAMLYTGTGTEKDSTTAVKLFELNAGQEDIESLTRLGDHYYIAVAVNRNNTTENMDRAFSLYSRASELGNSYATMMAGMCQKHMGNRIIAGSLLKKSAQSGCVAAFYHSALIYMDSGDMEKCLEQLRAGAEKEDTPCMALYGLLLYDTGEPRNYKEAMHYLEKAAAENDGMAQFYLSCIYSEGRGVKADYKKAFRYAVMSADTGYVCGYFQLGYFYEQGIGTEKDYAKALENYKKAMRKSHPDAPYRIGRIYEEGLGVEPDLKQARLYYETGAACGDGSAEKALRRLDLRERK